MFPKIPACHLNTTQLAISSPGVKGASVSLSVTVLPLRLYSPSKQYVMGLNCHVVTDATTGVASSFLCEDRVHFAEQLADIHQHGFLYATLIDQPTTLWDSYTAYKTALLGLLLMYYGLTGSIDSDRPVHKRIDEQRKVQRLDSAAFIAPESAKLDELTALHKGRHITAAFVRTADQFDHEKDALDMPIYTVDQPYVQGLIRTGGKRSSDKFDYWFWPAYENDPQANRLYAGFLLDRANLYGAFVPNYQPSAVGDPFSDPSSLEPARPSRSCDPVC